MIFDLNYSNVLKFISESTWNLKLLNDVFGFHIASSVAAIYLPKIPNDGKWILSSYNYIIASLKSVYRLLSQSNSFANSTMTTPWMVIWYLTVLEKSRYLLENILSKNYLEGVWIDVSRFSEKIFM